MIINWFDLRFFKENFISLKTHVKVSNANMGSHPDARTAPYITAVTSPHDFSNRATQESGGRLRGAEVKVHTRLLVVTEVRVRRVGTLSYLPLVRLATHKAERNKHNKVILLN